MVDVAGAVGKPAGVGLVGREREGRDGAAMATAGIGSNPRRTVLQAIDILLCERVAVLIDLTHWWPGIVELSSRCKIAADSHEGANKAGEDGNTQEGERGRVGDHSDEEARDIGTGENTYTEHEI